MTSATCGERSPMPASCSRTRRATEDIAPTRWPLLRLAASADDLVAGALRQVHPGVGLAVAPRRPRTGGVPRFAVVLACLGDAVTLLVVELRHGSGATLRARLERHREREGHGG